MLPILRLTERFAPLVHQGVLNEEFEYYQLIDVTENGMEEDGVHKYIDRYWGEIMKIKAPIWQMPFPTLA